ncbi:MAG: hypothetical protein LKJ86_09585 [Oscillibacter sp.]|jgi:hypothetical protein|nr:hypothetical protein [Oscillibacter sp.]
MTVNEAIERTQGKKSGMFNGFSARRAQALLQPGEEPAAAVVANIATRNERFPGVVVLTDRRVLAVCGLPGIRRSVIYDLDKLDKTEETASAITYKAVFFCEKTAFSMTVDPDVGEAFARHIAILNGEEEAFDAVDVDLNNSVLNPTLMRNKIRVRQAKERQRARRAAEMETLHKKQAGTQHSDPEDESPQEAARRLAQQLEEAKTKGRVEDTDPKAVAARLAAELAAEEISKKPAQSSQ